MHTYKMNLSWTNNGHYEYEHYNRDHKLTFSGNQGLNNSSAPEFFGNKDTANPEELLASALASCHMLTFLAIASKSGYQVEGYQDEAVATLDKNTEGKMCVTKITLSPKITFSGSNIPDSEKIKGLHDKAHKNCFIANSIKAVVEVI